MIIAVFDLDGTLYTGHIGQGIADHHKTHRTKRFFLYLYLSTHYPLWLLQKAGLVPDETGRSIWARDMAWLFRGWRPDEAEAASRWITENYVVPRLRPNIMMRLQNHQQSGHRILLLSGTPSPLLAAIGRELGIEEVVGTPLHMRNGRYTGRSEPPVCQGANKILRLERHIGETEEISWPESWAYADSHSDLPVLERVGHPVAVHPDAALDAHAKEHGWEIIGEKAEVF
jgi:HAD superfamily hydrolase (TIGR01490 family)